MPLTLPVAIRRKRAPRACGAAGAPDRPAAQRRSRGRRGAARPRRPSRPGRPGRSCAARPRRRRSARTRGATPSRSRLPALGLQLVGAVLQDARSEHVQRLARHDGPAQRVALDGVRLLLLGERVVADAARKKDRSGAGASSTSSRRNLTPGTSRRPSTRVTLVQRRRRPRSWYGRDLHDDVALLLLARRRPGRPLRARQRCRPAARCPAAGAQRRTSRHRRARPRRATAVRVIGRSSPGCCSLRCFACRRAVRRAIVTARASLLKPAVIAVEREGALVVDRPGCRGRRRPRRSRAQIQRPAAERIDRAVVAEHRAHHDQPACRGRHRRPGGRRARTGPSSALRPAASRRREATIASRPTPSPAAPADVRPSGRADRRHAGPGRGRRRAHTNSSASICRRPSQPPQSRMSSSGSSRRLRPMAAAPDCV